MNEANATRVIVLGASNVTLHFAALVQAIRNAPVAPGAPLEILAAHGLGRSYGTWSRVLGRALPGIRECGLWNAAETAPASTGRGSAEPARTVALITDIGNDVMYGQPAATITAWVGECIDRLQRMDARIAMTLLPIDSIQRLSPATFALIRAVLYPSRRITFERVVGESREVNDRLVELAGIRGIEALKMNADWYTIDHIHLRRSVAASIWRRTVTVWGGDPQSSSPIQSIALRGVDRTRLRLARPEVWKTWGFQRRGGAAVVLPGDTRVRYF